MASPWHGQCRIQVDMQTDNLNRRAFAEALGTFWLVLGGCGSAVLSAKFGAFGIGLLGVSLAFGLSFATIAWAIGHISGAHLNPAVTLGLVVAKRFPSRDLLPYWLAQLFGATLASGILFLIARGSPSFIAGTFATNGYGAQSVGGYSLGSALLTEVVMTFMFLMVIFGVTRDGAPKGFAALAVGLCLTVIHLISIPVTGTSVNPARSTGPALVVGGVALRQLWLFWLAPLLGAAVAGALQTSFLDARAPREQDEQAPSRREPTSHQTPAEHPV